MVSCVFSLTQTHIHTYKTPIKAATNAHTVHRQTHFSSMQHIYTLLLCICLHIYTRRLDKKKKLQNGRRLYFRIRTIADSSLFHCTHEGGYSFFKLWFNVWIRVKLKPVLWIKIFRISYLFWYYLMKVFTWHRTELKSLI